MMHPIRDDLPPATIQYADDTLILARASPQAAHKLKSILQLFQEATGLQINFQKTTLITLNIQPTEEQQIAAALDTTISSFPQTYLGLPLSPTKLPPPAFQPLIDRVDKYLAGWCASLLSKGGRLTLMSAVLDSLPTHFMASLFILLLIIEKLDKKRGAFFWAGEDSCSGSQCLVAWSRACLPKKYAGLGIKNLHLQNVCLLLKFCFRTLQKRKYTLETMDLTTISLPCHTRY
jgi:hypothetical protein